MSAIAEGLFQPTRRSRQISDFTLIALFSWASLMLALASANCGVDLTPMM